MSWLATRLTLAMVLALAAACASPASQDVGDPLALNGAEDDGMVSTVDDPLASPFDGALSGEADIDPFDPGDTDSQSGAGSPAGGAQGRSAGTSSGAGGASAGGSHTGSGAASGGTVNIGFQVSKNVTAAFAAVGAEGEPPEERAIVGALVDWANRNGGIAGRRIVPVIHETDATAGSFNTQAQAACAAFTEDQQVFAVGSSPVGGNDALLACLAQKGTPLVEQNHWLFDEPYYRRYPGLLFQPAKARPERWIPAWVDGLAEQRYFTDAVVGVVRFDAPAFERLATQHLLPRLARHGVKPAAHVAIRTPGGVSDFGAMAAEINNAILRFRAAGVTHVMILENAAILSFFWMPQADSSGYRPRYGMSSASTPTTVSNQAPEAQLTNAVGVGWAPPIDVYDAQHPGSNPIWATCMKILREAGLSTGYKSQGFYVHPHCDTVFFLRAAMELAPRFDVEGLRAGAAALGSTYLSPFSHRTHLAAGRMDGAAGWRAFGFDTKCACWQYRGAVRPLP